MRIVVSEINNRSVGFLVEDGRLIEVFRAGNGQTENGREGKSPEHFRVGEILVGRVRDVRSGLSAAFVNLLESSKEMEALGGAAYLPFSELPAGMSLRPEQLLPVQIVALPSGSKPFRVTSKLSLSGRYCAVGENIRGIQASKKLPRPMASKLKEQVRDYFGYHAVPGSAGTPAGEEDGERNGTGTSTVSAVPESPEKIPFSGDVGIMIRTNARIPAEEGNPEAVTEEAESLMRKLRQIRAAAAARTGGSVLYSGDDELYGKIRDCIPDKIIIDTGVPEEIRKKAEDAAAQYRVPAEALPGENTVSGTASYLVVSGIRRQIDELKNRRIWLKSGAYLVIDRTEALTAIDVNTGKSEAAVRANGSGFHEEAAEKHRFEVNMEAADEIFRQIRLRNLAGMILIDFINVSAEHRKMLGEKLERLCRKDPLPTSFVDFTGLGLAEITRRKNGESPEQICFCENT